MDTRNKKEERLQVAMRIVSREQIDDVQWNALVDRTPTASFFSYTWYLDATAENWCALVDEDYKSGMALPFSVRLGVETLYTPIFVRYLELLGISVLQPAVKAIVDKRFGNSHICTRQPVFGGKFEEFIYQEIAPTDERKLNTQAKRMLKKSIKNSVGIKAHSDYSSVLRFIQQELEGKHEGLTKSSMLALEKLVIAADKENALMVLETSNGGGILCLEKDDRIMYLKGATDHETKNSGGMYALLNTVIDKALAKNKVFDFGGSRVEGVKRFNKNLGGSDVQYFNYKVDKTPFWFKFARRIKNTWKK